MKNESKCNFKLLCKLRLFFNVLRLKIFTAKHWWLCCVLFVERTKHCTNPIPFSKSFSRENIMFFAFFLSLFLFQKFVHSISIVLFALLYPIYASNIWIRVIECTNRLTLKSIYWKFIHQFKKGKYLFESSK